MPPKTTFEESPRNTGTCFRITAIPPSWSHNDLKEKLKMIDPHLKDFSISGPHPESCNDQLGVALLDVDGLTDFLKGVLPGQRRTLPKDTPESDRTDGPFIDRHFYNLTTMNTPQGPVIAE